MIHIDFTGKTPVNTPANPETPSWKPWTAAAWQAWLDTSQEYLAELIALNDLGKLDERNDYIDRHSTHWKKLKPWLEALSHGKCWFSEARESYSYYQVEHFRPKSKRKAHDGAETDGYWWLAFDYTNYRLCGGVGNANKGIWFPLKGSICSLYSNQCEESELHYLLDPTNPNDPDLIAFDEEGKASPSDLCMSAWDRDRVTLTIEKLKLDAHEPLSEARRKVWQTVSREIDQYLCALQKAATGDNPAMRESARDHATRIKELVSPVAELSSVARWCVRYRNNPQLLRFVG